MINSNNKKIYKKVEQLSSPIENEANEIAIILAAGHGKRIKSQKSKMLHKIWGVPTVQRVYNACVSGIRNINSIIVVGIKAEDVMGVVGKKDRNSFAYQETQDGTGHAVQVALKNIKNKSFDGIVYVLPGDMGLIDKETIRYFRKEFIKSKSDMMVLTGIYEGDPDGNSYGRIIRVKETDEKGKPSLKDEGKVIRIMENKDIHALPEDRAYKVKFNGKVYAYSKKELINNNEFNSGVYAFKYNRLKQLINKLSSNNVQKEIYITDLIELFNKNKFTVQAVSPREQHVVMGFNNKSVLKEMEAVARNKVYEKLKDIIEIDDPEDFFIHESVVDDIIRMDKKNIPLDIKIGKGVHVDEGAKLNYELFLGKNVFISGKIQFDKGVRIRESSKLTCFIDQKMKLGENVEILSGDIIKGNVNIGAETRIESGVNITGSNEFPTRIGENVLIKGTSYLFGSKIGDGVYIERSVFIRKKIKSSEIVKYYLPPAEGKEAVTDLQ